MNPDFWKVWMEAVVPAHLKR